MPGAKLSMRKIREIMRLKFSLGMNNRDIASSCNISPGTVSETLFRLKLREIQWPLPDILTDEKLEEKLFPIPADGLEDRNVPQWEEIYRELQKKHVTLMLLWQEYHEQYPDGYGYSWFCEHYHEWRQKLDLVMRQHHIFGEKCFVDYAGTTVSIIDPHTGEVKESQIFIGVLGASNYPYVEATWSQKISDWIGSHVRMINHFGGCPKILVPDNLKSGVTKACYYEPEINRTYHEFADYYGIAVVPARKYKPKDKAKVENGVLLIERWILARLRNRTFYFLDELNSAIREICREIVDRPFQKLPGTRRSVFEQEEKKMLLPLPSTPFEIGEWKKARVNNDYHIEVDDHYYSVHYTYHREQVEARLSSSTVEIFHKGLRIASHKRSFAKGGFTTVADHMPSHHREKAEWTTDRILAWADSFGPAVKIVVEGIMANRRHPEQAFRSCFGLLNLAKKVERKRFLSACQRAAAFRAFSYKSVKSILDKGLDREPLPENVTPIGIKSAGHHENVRGALYYATEGERS